VPSSRLSSQPIVVITCQVLQEMLEPLLSEAFGQEVKTIVMDYGLHRVPAKMTMALQQEINDITEPSLVVLGYGLCGNGLRGLDSGPHTLLVPRTDDCIALLLGSYRAYMREFQAVPGTYYLTKGWLESGSNPLQEYEEYTTKYGAEQAAWLVDQQYQNYERVALVAHSEADLEAYRPQAQKVAAFCRRWDMRYEEILGSDAYVRRLVEAAAVLTNGSGDELPSWLSRDLVIVNPGEKVLQEAFWR
jgi:hypothetical protein